MICVTIGRGRHSSLAEEWKAAADAGVGLVELRLDCLRREPELKRILKERFTPLIVTIRRGADGGLWRGTEEKRQGLLREAIALGIDYVDLELDIASKIRRYGKTKRIVSYHNMKETPAELAETAEQCAELDADIVKLATKAESVADSSRVLQVGRDASLPAIAIAMGEIGSFTRVLGPKFGAPFTYANFNPERVFAPGMLSYHVLKRDYCYDQIDKETEVYAVIGDPIEQSLSPAIHNPSFRHLGLNKVMVPLLIPAANLAASLKELEWLGIQGMSVTIPHKEGIIALLHEKDEAVEKVGACNTVVIREGRWRGANTDLPAAMHSLETAMGGELDGNSPLLDKQVMILGAGGVARAIAFGLERRGAIITIANRHDERANELAEAVGARTVNWSMRGSLTPHVMINCTPVGMHPDVDDTPMPPGGFNRPDMVVFDTIYHPEHTMFLKLAKDRGCASMVSGVDMFVYQAAAQFHLYTGQRAPIDVMRANLKRKLGPLRE